MPAELATRHQIRAGPDQQLAQALPRADRQTHRRSRMAGPAEPGAHPLGERGTPTAGKVDLDQRRDLAGSVPAHRVGWAAATPCRHRAIAGLGVRLRIGSISSSATQPGAAAMRSAGSRRATPDSDQASASAPASAGPPDAAGRRAAAPTRHGMRGTPGMPSRSGESTEVPELHRGTRARPGSSAGRQTGTMPPCLRPIKDSARFVFKCNLPYLRGVLGLSLAASAGLPLVGAACQKKGGARYCLHHVCTYRSAPQARREPLRTALPR